MHHSITPINVLTDLFFIKQRNLTEYFVAVDVNNMLQLYASMLHERRIIITSSKLSTVSTSHVLFQVQYIKHCTKKGLQTSADLNMFGLYLWDNIYIHFKKIGFNLSLEAQKSDL